MDNPQLLLFGALGLLLLLVLIIGGAALGAYNVLVKLRNAVRNGFAQVDVQLQRRHDLIPNIVETAKGFMTHERETLEAVIQARNAAVSAREAAQSDPTDASKIGQLSQAENNLSMGLGRLFALSEAYPELKSDQTMLKLQDTLSETEDKVAFARQTYNHAVTEFNTKRESFPTIIFAGMFGFEKASWFEVQDEAVRTEAPKVSFD